MRVGTLKTLLIGNFRHRNLKNIFFKGLKNDYLRMAYFAIVMMKTQQNFRSWIKKGVAGRESEVKSHVRLPNQFTANYFADSLKEKSKT